MDGPASPGHSGTMNRADTELSIDPASCKSGSSAPQSAKRVARHRMTLLTRTVEAPSCEETSCIPWGDGLTSFGVATMQTHRTTTLSEPSCTTRPSSSRGFARTSRERVADNANARFGLDRHHAATDRSHSAAPSESKWNGGSRSRPSHSRLVNDPAHDSLTCVKRKRLRHFSKPFLRLDKLVRKRGGALPRSRRRLHGLSRTASGRRSRASLWESLARDRTCRSVR